MSKRRYFLKTETPLRVCPWRYNVCRATESRPCPYEAKIAAVPDPVSWFKEVNNTWACPDLGAKLTREQWAHCSLGNLL
jgi:hypothetical protein